VADHYYFVNAPTKLGQDKISIVDASQEESKICLQIISKCQKAGVHLGITVTNENVNYEEINYLLLHLSVLYHEASR